ncbi:MAG: fused signal recognition particle receptor [Candidatus Azotimanducaceae bacterium]
MNEGHNKAVSEETTDPQDTGGMWGKLRNGLAKTRAQLAEGVGNLLLGEREINEDVLDDLETALLLTDVGVETTQSIMEELSGRVRRKELNDTQALHDALKGLLVQRLKPLEKALTITAKPHVIFFVGVNGVGKTTSIGKLAKQLQAQGKSVLLAAGDTFRAAAVEQLQAWGERNQVQVISQGQGADSASVAYDAVEAAQARNVDVLLIDTAGRLQAQEQLMDELKKVHRVVKRLDEDAPHDVILVLDGGVGQNAISQVKLFGEAVDVSGLIVSKLDGSAKAGVLFAVAATLDRTIPVHYIGVGEGVDDLREFSATEFVEALLAAD